MSLSVLVFAIPIAFLLVGIQSLIFTFLMEFVVLPHISTRSSVIVVGIGLGVLSSLYFGGMYCYIGAVVGGLCSNLMFRSFNAANKPIKVDK